MFFFKNYFNWFDHFGNEMNKPQIIITKFIDILHNEAACPLEYIDHLLLPLLKIEHAEKNEEITCLCDRTASFYSHYKICIESSIQFDFVLFIQKNLECFLCEQSVLPCLYCSYFDSFHRANFLFHFYFGYSSFFAHISDDNEITKWQIQTIWHETYFDFKRISSHITWLPEELLNEIIQMIF